MDTLLATTQTVNGTYDPVGSPNNFTVTRAANPTNYDFFIAEAIQRLVLGLPMTVNGSIPRVLLSVTSLAGGSTTIYNFV